MAAKQIVFDGAAPQNQSESLVIRTLTELLPSTYTVIANFEITQKGGTPQEYDGVVIAPHAVYVIEIKGYAGRIRGDDHQWEVRGKPYPAPLSTTNQKARVLKSVIERKLSGISLWVEPLIILSDDRVELDLRGSVKDYTVRLVDAADVLRDRTRLTHPAELRNYREQIVLAIREAAVGRSAQVKRFGDFVVEDTLLHTEAYAEYLARHAERNSERRYRLRVFTYNPYADAEILARRLAQIQREAEALETLGSHPNVTAYRTHFNDVRDPNLYITVTDWEPESKTLRSLLLGDALPTDFVIGTARDIAAGLQAAHAKNIYHRDIRPENIQLDAAGQARLINFDYAKISGVTDKATLLPRDMLATPNPYLPPEWLDPAVEAQPSGDLYSLGAVLFEMLVGSTVYDTPHDAQHGTTTLGGPNAYRSDPIPERLNDLIMRMLHRDSGRRPQSAGEVLEDLDQITPKEVPINEVAAEVVRDLPSQSPYPAIFQLDDLIEGKYSVQSVLPAGGSGRVYKVYDRFSDRVYALKVFNDSSHSESFVMNEFRSLQALSQHKHIVTIKDALVLRDGRYAIVSEYVEGDDLSKSIAPDTPIAIRTVLTLIIELLDALDHIHQQGWIHRDIKPSNVILSRHGIKLIDFNIAARSDQASTTYIGTPAYILPDVVQTGWTSVADVFAAGVLMYELATGQHPYPNRQPVVNGKPFDPRQHPATSNLGEKLSKLLMQAASTKKGFASAADMRKAVQSILKRPDEWFIREASNDESLPLPLYPWEQDKPNYNPYVTRFLRLFSQASRDNSGTRGLDAIARITYAETLLDQKLRADILTGRYRLVIITGNAGDGKTAFIQQIESEAKKRSADYERLNDNSARFHLDKLTFQTNYDGSQDESSRGSDGENDRVLEAFFLPFADPSSEDQRQNLVRLIAINQGRLLDFFLDEERTGFQTLRRWIDCFFDPLSEDPSAELPDWLLIVDLNQRSVTAQNDQLDSIFNRQLESFLKPQFWQACESCALKDQCFIKFNADSLRDSTGGSIVRERLRTLFEVVHLRRKLHITMRDLRSALIWSLLRDQDCDSVARIVEKNDPDQRLHLLYYSAFAADGKPAQDGVDDRLVRLLREIDPAEVANPALDRALHTRGIKDVVPLIEFEQRASIDEQQITLKRLLAWTQQIRDGDSKRGAVSRAINRILRRVVFFEGRGEDWRDMFPYRKLDTFRSAANTDEQHEQIKRAIARGISRLEGVLPQDDDDAVYLRAGSETRTKLMSFRTFPLHDFALRIPLARSGVYTEYTPDRIVFYHTTGDAELVISLDLLELLHQTGEGYMLSPDVRQGIFLNYLVFRRALMHLPYTSVLLQRRNGDRFRLVHEGETIVLEPLSLR